MEKKTIIAYSFILLALSFISVSHGAMSALMIGGITLLSTFLIKKYEFEDDEYLNEECQKALDKAGLKYKTLLDKVLLPRLAKMSIEGAIIGCSTAEANGDRAHSAQKVSSLIRAAAICDGL